MGEGGGEGNFIMCERVQAHGHFVVKDRFSYGLMHAIRCQIVECFGVVRQDLFFDSRL